MSDKLIYCSKCGRHVGTLKEGSKTLIGLTYHCPRCNSSSMSSEKITSMFTEIFGAGTYKRR